MANTYIAIQTITVPLAGSPTISFTSIPATYTDLVLLLSLRTDGAGSAYGAIGQITLNSTTSGYTVRDIYGFGSGGAGGGGFSFATTYIPTGRDNNSTQTASTFSNQSVYITNYTSSANKAISVDAVNENNNTTNMVTALLSAISTVTSAITAITITSGNGDYVQYSSATLYGIKSS